MRLTKMNGETERAYRTLKDAINAVTFDAKELNNEKFVSVGVGIDDEGNKWYVVGSYNEFTNCYYKDLNNVDEWFETDWIEQESC